MKAQNLNNSSKKTRKTIKRVFAEMLSEKKELGKVSVSELCARAEISRGTFYAHYDDIYGVAEDYENELIENFFDNTKILQPTNMEEFIDIFFDYMKQNHDSYKMLCRSNDFIFTAKKLTTIACNKFYELCLADKRIADKNLLFLDISIFVDGITCEYVKMCRNYTSVTLEELFEYTKIWFRSFASRRAPSSV